MPVQINTNYQLSRKPGVHAPRVLVVVLDGVGVKDPSENLTAAVKEGIGVLPACAFISGNAVNAAYTPHLQELFSGSYSRTLLAHGPAVGLPSFDDMGNSEVGHNALGAGRIFDQGAKLVSQAIENGSLFVGEAWKSVALDPTLLNGNQTLHLCGLLSDGNVHSHIDHLFALIRGARAGGVKRVRLHTLLDGRDVGPLSALEYVERLECFLKEVCYEDFDCKVASGGGRSFVTMDRYGSNWSIVERGYRAHVCGEGRQFASLRHAIETLRQETGLTDQDLPAFVIAENGEPVGRVVDGDSFIFFNFRGDRSIQITCALTQEHFSAFPRPIFPRIRYAGMMQYDGDLCLPKNFLVSPPSIEQTCTELLSRAGVPQFACSETQKFGHVTYFWNGNRSGKFRADLEDYVEIPSDKAPFDERPWMKSAEIADETIARMREGSFQVGRINLANGDMVGHTGNFAATILSVGSVDLAVGRLMKAALETDTVLIVTADHGNADEMFETDKKSGNLLKDTLGNPRLKTSHTLSPVPFAIYNAAAYPAPIFLKKNLPQAGLANVAATVLELAGFEAPDFYEPSLVEFSSPSSLESKELKEPEPLGVTEKKFSQNQPSQRYALARAALVFADTVAYLRDPIRGCPWDKEQTISSLRPYFIEEVYEAVEVANRIASGTGEQKNYNEFCEELGDVLLQIYLNSQILSEEKQFSISDVFVKINQKMIHRHPHLFAREKIEGQTPTNPTEVTALWEKVKNTEQKEASKTVSLMHPVSRKRFLPSLNYGTQISQAAWKLGFTWPTLADTFAQVQAEIEELHEELERESIDLSAVVEEIGDVVFSLCHLVNFFKQTYAEAFHMDFDLIVRQSIGKFLHRFETMEAIAASQGKPLSSSEMTQKLTLDEWESLWKEAKKRSRQ